MLLKDKCFMIIMMFKSIHGLVPDYICDEITMQRDITDRTTRSTVNNNVGLTCATYYTWML